MKKNRMELPPNGAPVLVKETETTATTTQGNASQEAPEVKTATPGETIPEETQEPEPTKVQAPEPTEVKTIPLNPPKVDNRTAAQLIAEMQQKMDDRQKLIHRFNELEHKHRKFSEAMEVLSPDTCEVALLVNGSRFTSSDPAAVRRCMTYQVETYSAEMEIVASLLLK